MAKKSKKRGKRPAARAPVRLSRSSGLQPVGPVLMAPPLEDAGRRFTFALAGKGSGAAQRVTVVETIFKWPMGLWRLKSSPTLAGEYVKWAKQMCQTLQPGSARLYERVLVPRGMFARKTWEIGQAVALGKMGDQVDATLAQRFGRPPVAPPHPARKLDVASAASLTVAELGGLPERLIAFYQKDSMPVLEQVWGESGGSRLIKGGAGDALPRVVREWVQDWGVEALDEVFLDLATYCGASNDLDGARSFLHVVSAETQNEREDAMVDFLVDWVRTHFSRPRKGPRLL